MRACTDASRAAEIGKILGERGLDATVQPIEDVSDVSGFDAYVVGSAVYAGRWMGEVVHMVGVGAWANAIAESLTAASGAEST